MINFVKVKSMFDTAQEIMAKIEVDPNNLNDYDIENIHFCLVNLVSIIEKSNVDI